MNWHKKFTDNLADILRFIIRGALLVGSIAMASALSYLLIKFCWFTIRWLDRTLFSQPW